MTKAKIDPVDARNYVISYNTLRTSVGILGIALPILLLLGTLILDNQPQPLNSISSYAHTKMGNGFVGIMCAVALFMFSYLGHDRKDNIAGHLAAFFALGVAFFPNNISNPKSWINIVHLFSALFFFGTLIYFSLCLFTKTNQKIMSQQKKNRNKIYRICGYTMFACIVLIAIYMFWLIKIFPNHGIFQPVFWLESLALLAFGISWITKGQVIYRD